MRALLLVAIASTTVLAVTLIAWLALTGTGNQTPATDVQMRPQSSSWIAVIAGADDSLPIGSDGRGVPVPLKPTAPLPGQDDSLPQPPTPTP